MRRLLVLLISGALLLPMVHTSAAPIAAKRQQGADAFWMVPTEKPNHFIGYYAAAHLDEPGDGDFSWDAASVGKGRCVRERTKRFVSTSCTFTGWVSGKASEHFSMDPTMESAELSLTHKGQDFHVTWAGDEFGTYTAQEICMTEGDNDSREGYGAGLIRLAKAEGHIFGRHLISKGPFSGMLETGAMVTECTRARKLASLQPGESLTVTL